VLRTGGMIMTGEIRSTWKETCPSATSSTTNVTSAGLELDPSLRGERPILTSITYKDSFRTAQ